MEFFIDDKDTENKFLEIFKKVQVLKNGETHFEMKKMGLNYQKSLGATIVNLRELAAQYSKNHLLAHKLWTKGYRETKILASLIEEPDKVNPEQVERWIEEMDSNELIEQINMNLFVNLPDVCDLMLTWISSKNYRKVLSALITTGRLAMRKKELDSEFLNLFVKKLPPNIDEHFLRNQMKRCLGKIVRLNKNISSQICEMVNKLKVSDENWKEVWDDLKYELEL